MRSPGSSTPGSADGLHSTAAMFVKIRPIKAEFINFWVQKHVFIMTTQTKIVAEKENLGQTLQCELWSTMCGIRNNGSILIKFLNRHFLLRKVHRITVFCDEFIFSEKSFARNWKLHDPDANSKKYFRTGSETGNNVNFWADNFQLSCTKIYRTPIICVRSNILLLWSLAICITWFLPTNIRYFKKILPFKHLYLLPVDL